MTYGGTSQVTDLAVRVKCPGCGSKIDLRAADLAPGSFKRCFYCGVKLHFGGDNGSDVQQAAEELARSLDGLSKALKVEL